MGNVLSIVNQTQPLEDEVLELQGVLPTQFYGARRGASAAEPWRRLMAAMLLDAVRCYQTKFTHDKLHGIRSLRKRVRGSSLIETTAHSLSEPYATRWRSTRKLFGEDSRAGKRDG
jgi:hypothetical protein